MSGPAKNTNGGNTTSNTGNQTSSSSQPADTTSPMGRFLAENQYNDPWTHYRISQQGSGGNSGSGTGGQSGNTGSRG